MMRDQAEVESLLNILHKSNPRDWPKLKSIHDQAMAALEKVAEDIASEAEKAQEAMKAAAPNVIKRPDFKGESDDSANSE